MRQRLVVFTFSIAAALVAPRPAFAYLDPGTGSMILQGALAALFAAAFTVKMYWHRLKTLFRKPSHGEIAASEDNPG